MVAKIDFINFERYREMIKRLYEQTANQYDVVIGLHRGGSVPAIHLSHKLGIPCVNVEWSLRDGTITDRSLVDAKYLSELVHIQKQRVLIVDDIIDSGDSIRSLLSRANVESSMVGIACLIYNEDQSTKPNYWCRSISRSVQKQWFEFWWEF